MSHNIYEEKNPMKAVFYAAFPAMLGQITTLIYNIADTYFVSLTRDPNQISAVTLCSPLLLICMSIACVFGTGGASLAARLLGAKDTQQVKKTSSFCFWAMIAISILTSVIGLVFSTGIAKILGADESNLKFTVDYLNYIFLGCIFVMLANGMLHMFRSVGYIKQGTIGLILGNAINIVLDYIFIVLLNMQTAGAALATSLGFCGTTVYFIICMICFEHKGEHYLPLSPKEFSMQKDIVAEVLKIGIPGSLITILLSFSNIVLNNFLGIYGSEAIAAYGIAAKIVMIPIMLSVGLAQGVAPLIGFCYGAKEINRMKKTVTISNVFGVIMGSIFLVLFLTLTNQIIMLFLKDPELVALSSKMLLILTASAPVFGILNITSAFYQALGKPLPSLILTILRNVVIFIILIIVLNHFYHLEGVIAAQPVTEYLMTVASIILYLKSIKKLDKADKKE